MRDLKNEELRKIVSGEPLDDELQEIKEQMLNPIRNQTLQKVWTGRKQCAYVIADREIED